MRKTILAVLAVTVLLGGCGQAQSVDLDNYVTKEEYDKVVEERDSYKAQLQDLNASNMSDDTKSIKMDSDAEKEEKDETKEPTDNKEANVEIIAEYTLADGIGWYTRHFLVIKNNSDETMEVSTSSLAYSEDGTMLGAANADFDALGAGCVSVMYEAFEVEDKIGYYETELNASPSKHYASVIQDLEYVQNDIKDGAVFQVTNNGEEAAEFVKGCALFFLGDELVGYEECYFTDDDSKIKPGKTISKQLTSYDDFDRIEFYLDGRIYHY